MRFFPLNEHPIERLLRIVFGLVILSLVFFGPQTAWGFLGAIPLITGVIGSCPLYTMLGFSTCPAQRQTA